MRRLLLTVCLAVGVSAPDSALAAENAAGIGIDIEFERFELANGLEVILHRDTSAPQVAINIWYHVGSGDEDPGKSGFAHLFEHMMFQGAKHIGEDVHFDTLREIGGTGVNGTTNTDRTNYFETVPSHQLETGLWLESDRMGYLLDLLNEESLANQRDVVRNERRQRYDNVPYGQARFAIAAALYPEGHPYRYLTIGRHEELEAASLDDVRAFFLKWYVPSNATLTLAGDFEVEEAKSAVEKWFGSFPKLDRPARKTVETPALAKDVRTVIEDEFAKLEQIQYTWHAPANLAEGNFELAAAAQVLGAQGWGRLYRRLVLDEKLCRFVYAYNDGRQATGTFNVVASLKPKSDRKRVEAIIEEEVARLAKDPASPRELARVVVNVRASFVWSLESLSSRANRLQRFNHFAGDPGYSNVYVERLEAVTPKGLQKVAKDWLSRHHVEVVSVPKGAN
jgi:zinc protease